MPTDEDEVRALFAEMEALPAPSESAPEEVRILQRGAREAFRHESIREALWYLLLQAPMAGMLRPIVFSLSRWMQESGK